MSGNGQVGVTQSDASEVLLESGLEGSLSLPNVQFAAAAARNSIHDVVHLAVKWSADFESGVWADHHCVRVEERTSRATLLCTRMCAWSQLGSTGRRIPESGVDQPVPYVGHPLVGHKWG